MKRDEKHHLLMSKDTLFQMKRAKIVRGGAFVLAEKNIVINQDEGMKCCCFW